jgi:hypothetical protein
MFGRTFSMMDVDLLTLSLCSDNWHTFPTRQINFNKIFILWLNPNIQVATQVFFMFREFLSLKNIQLSDFENPPRNTFLLSFCFQSFPNVVASDKTGAMVHQISFSSQTPVARSPKTRNSKMIKRIFHL